MKTTTINIINHTDESSRVVDEAEMVWNEFYEPQYLNNDGSLNLLAIKLDLLSYYKEVMKPLMDRFQPVPHTRAEAQVIWDKVVKDKKR